MAKATFKLTGDKKAAAKLRKIAAQYPAKIGQALYLEGELIMTDSKQNHVPVDENALRVSGKTWPPKGQGVKTEVELTYGDASAPYALAVHEHPSVHSPMSWKGKYIRFSPEGHGPKYLERPMMKATAGMPARLAKQLDVDKVV